jgi:hypothetical protein
MIPEVHQDRYGIAKDVGGDSKKNVMKMEKMVNSIMKKGGKSKESAIKIAKHSFQMMKRAKMRKK